jgi:hypothetical protein
MARDLRRQGGGFPVPGLYEKLVRQTAELALCPDPRLLLSDEKAFYLLNRTAVVAVDGRIAELMTAGEPVEVDSWYLGRSEAAQRLREAADASMVFPDDSVVAA